MSIGSPTPSISGITHLRSKALASTILKIFCTFIEAEVEQNIREACMARAKRLACFVISSCSSLGNVAKVSNLVPIRKGIAVLLNPRAWRYHSLTELSVDFRDRSNMKSIATASLQTRGSMFTNSLWPPRSHIENVIVVRRTEMVFSMKLSPASGYSLRQNSLLHTWPLNWSFQSESHRPSQLWWQRCSFHRLNLTELKCWHRYWKRMKGLRTLGAHCRERGRRKRKGREC